MAGDLDLTTDTDLTVPQDRPGPPVLVRMGTLDAASVRLARSALAHPAIRAACEVVVDLTCLDDRHELTGFALLTELNRSLARSGGALTAVNPPGRMAANLQACSVLVSHEVPVCRPGGLVLEVGALPRQRRQSP